MQSYHEKTESHLLYSFEGPEGVKWELGFGQIFTEKVGFGSQLGLGFGHWE